MEVIGSFGQCLKLNLLSGLSICSYYYHGAFLFVVRSEVLPMRSRLHEPDGLIRFQGRVFLPFQKRISVVVELHGIFFLRFQGSSMCLERISAPQSDTLLRFPLSSQEEVNPTSTYYL